MKTWRTNSGCEIIQVLSGRSNVFLLTNGEKNILVDTSVKLMRRALENRLNELDIARIDYLILTHTHMDHAGNARWAREKYQAPVIVHKDEASYLMSGKNVMISGTNFITRPLLNLTAKWAAPKIKFESCQYDLLVDERFDLKDLGFNAYILHTPGHTPGSMSVVVDGEVAMVGDCMFGVFPGSVFPPFAVDVPQMIKSWGKLLETGCRVFLPSHGTANGRALVERDFNKRKKKGPG